MILFEYVRFRSVQKMVGCYQYIIFYLKIHYFKFNFSLITLTYIYIFFFLFSSYLFLELQVIFVIGKSIIERPSRSKYCSMLVYRLLISTILYYSTVPIIFFYSDNILVYLMSPASASTQLLSKIHCLSMW